MIMKPMLTLITGASSGIGQACARKFAQAGHRLILNARSVDKLQALKQELEQAYATDVLLLPFDVRDRAKAEEAIRTLPANFRDIDVLINNAGLALGTDKEHECDLDDAFTMIDTNVKGLSDALDLLEASRNAGFEPEITILQDAAWTMRANGLDFELMERVTKDLNFMPL